MQKPSPDDLILFGKILKPKGLKGELKVFLYNSYSDVLKNNIKTWFKTDNDYICYELQLINSLSKYIIIKLFGINNRESAESFKDKDFFISRNDFPELKGDDFYLFDLIGFSIQDEFDKNYGIIADIISFPTNESLLIQYNDKEIIIPVIDNFIKLFDFDNKLVVVKNSDIFLNKC